MDIKEITKQITQYINEIKLSDINGMPIFNPVILITIAVVVILLCRQIVCWYFKQNEQVALLKEIRALLKGSIQEQASSKKQTRAPVKQEVQNHNPTAEGSRAEDFATEQEWLAWLFDQPIDNLTENNLKELISVTKRAGQYEKCKAYLECIITKYPDSAYIKFIAKDRLKEIRAFLKGSIQEQASSKKQTRAPVKQEVQNHNPTAEGSQTEDFTTEQEWLAWFNRQS
jgi:hypothetical protein